jgi:hypothetical protein
MRESPVSVEVIEIHPPAYKPEGLNCGAKMNLNWKKKLTNK